MLISNKILPNLPNIHKKLLPFIFLFVSYCLSVIFCLIISDKFFLSDINELFRVPLFMILPIFIGIYLVQGNDEFFDEFARFFVVLYIYNFIVILFQFFDISNGLFYTLYSQKGLNEGSNRASGVSLFIQECAWIVYITTAMIVVYKYKYKKHLSGILLSAPSLLTLSKTVYLSFILLVFPFSVNKKAKFSFLKFILVIILIVIVGSIFYYILIDLPQFKGSIIDGFSSNSKSVSNRQGQITNLINDLNDNTIGYIFGVKPILSYLGVRVEASFFNIFAKIGILGTIAYYCCINILLFIKQKGPRYIVLLKNIMIGIGISLSLVSVTGASVEGVKGMFFYYLIIGVILSYNKQQS
jgi:hypothetical protein